MQKLKRNTMSQKVNFIKANNQFLVFFAILMVGKKKYDCRIQTFMIRPKLYKFGSELRSITSQSPDYFKDLSFHVLFHTKFGYMGCSHSTL